jgi:hypothetical protein
LSRPPRRLEKVTWRLVAFSIRFICVFPRTILPFFRSIRPKSENPAPPDRSGQAVVVVARGEEEGEVRELSELGRPGRAKSGNPGGGGRGSKLGRQMETHQKWQGRRGGEVRWWLRCSSRVRRAVAPCPARPLLGFPFWSLMALP